MKEQPDARPLVAHVLFRFHIGGLENGVVNLINKMPEAAYRHAIISLTDITDFRERIQRRDVQFVALNKPPGHAFSIYPHLYRIFRDLRPAIVHSRNLAALEVTFPAWLARVPVVIHGEHGRDVSDLDGSNKKYQWVRRAYRPFVDKFVALSKDLESYLADKVGVPRQRIAQIYNGVDSHKFHPAPTGKRPIPGCPFSASDLWLIGTVGRMQAVKDQITLTRAFIAMLETSPQLCGRCRLVLVGDGPLREEAKKLLAGTGMADLAWLPGERNDIADILRGLDCFVLPSLAEGISNTILEAMACGLPVIATDVGGNGELVEAGMTGMLVAAADPEKMACQLAAYAENPESARTAGRAGRLSIEQRFSLGAMVSQYQSLYDSLLASGRKP